MKNSELSTPLLHELISWGEMQLNHHQIENPHRNVLWMASDLFDCRMSDLPFSQKPVSYHQLKTFKKWIGRRVNHEPVQKITGKTEFYGLTFYLDSGVFIPRPETERLVDEVLGLITKQNPISILDVGTGSGCLAVALAKECENSQITAIDISTRALKIAKINRDYHELKNIRFKKMDILTETPKHTYDLVISNPPYIPKKDMKFLMPEVIDHDPVLALTDNADGLIFYRYLAKHFHSLVNPNGYMVLETGSREHSFKAIKIFCHYGYNADLKKDYSGNHRVLIVQSK
ncbi:MAG: peptide chain release factor N(5)-glutamine methyltransferase [Candidatus Marinimicrobia bacterium]|mgnify:CR=1 FL=1|jgi:release factor glutamine methyltransferase|nr:peptide chain release factor N(5)-glutamine methyltransferase [Candidatus Neomarinimicrobiota bacterium]